MAHIEQGRLFYGLVLRFHGVAHIGQGRLFYFVFMGWLILDKVDCFISFSWGGSYWTKSIVLLRFHGVAHIEQGQLFYFVFMGWFILNKVDCFTPFPWGGSYFGRVNLYPSLPF